MSLAATFKRLVRWSGPQLFDPQEYWEARHRSFGKSLKAVGHIELADDANAAQYELKRSRLADMIRRHVPDRSGRALLDAGCGIGVLTRAFVDLGFEVVGVDFSAHAIRRARAMGVRARFVVSPLAPLELGRLFDVITVTDVLLHVVADRDWHDTLSSLKRHLKPDGLLTILDRFADDTDGWSAHCKPRSLAQYTDALADLGLRIVEHEQFKLDREGATKDLLAVRRNGRG